MSKLSLDKSNQQALAAAGVASGMSLNVMFLAFQCLYYLGTWIEWYQGGWIATIANFGVLGA